MDGVYRKSPRLYRVGTAAAFGEALPPIRQASNPHAARQDFAAKVVRRLIDPGVRVAVLDEHGRPALVNCSDRLYEVLAKDHPIVGIYAQGALIPDVIDDLKAAGL